MAERDPLSVHYDGVVRALMLRAARASGQRRGVLAHVTSPRGEFRHPDRGGRTRHERAFTRAAYYLIFSNGGQGGSSGWSLKLTWGPETAPSARGRLARPVVVRLFPRGQARVQGERWVGTARQSVSGGRIDDLPDSVDIGGCGRRLV
jgi:hypothetical protein